MKFLYIHFVPRSVQDAGVWWLRVGVVCALQMPAGVCVFVQWVSVAAQCEKRQACGVGGPHIAVLGPADPPSAA